MDKFEFNDIEQGVIVTALRNYQEYVSDYILKEGFDLRIDINYYHKIWDICDDLICYIYESVRSERNGSNDRT